MLSCSISSELGLLHIIDVAELRLVMQQLWTVPLPAIYTSEGFFLSQSAQGKIEQRQQQKLSKISFGCASMPKQPIALLAKIVTKIEICYGIVLVLQKH